jgi:hypothetical protein
MVVAYKLKRISLENDKYGNVIHIKMVEKFVDWKHDSFIPLEEAIQFLDKAVIYEDDFNSVMSKADKKKNQIWLF